MLETFVGMAGFEPASSPAPKAGGVTGLPNIPKIMGCGLVVPLCSPLTSH